MDIKQDLANKTNYTSSKKRNINTIKFIVVHYTGNDGDTNEGNINYFKEKNKKASAHYFVDDNDIIQSVPDEHVAWHCGGKVYNDVKETGGAKYNKICTNSNSIGIEICDNVRNKKYELTEKTRQNVIGLIVMLMKKYSITVENVVRHFDCTGKYCPIYFCKPYGNEMEWQRFKIDINSAYKNNCNEENNKEYLVEIIATELNIRNEPSVKSKINGTIKNKGIYTIVDEINNWGKLKSGAGWINLNYTKKIHKGVGIIE